MSVLDLNVKLIASFTRRAQCLPSFKDNAEMHPLTHIRAIEQDLKDKSFKFFPSDVLSFVSRTMRFRLKDLLLIRHQPFSFSLAYRHAAGSRHIPHKKTDSTHSKAIQNIQLCPRLFDIDLFLAYSHSLPFDREEKNGKKKKCKKMQAI